MRGAGLVLERECGRFLAFVNECHPPSLLDYTWLYLRSHPMKVDFTVNGKAVSVDVPAQMPLLWVLRDSLSLKGTKYGCGEGQCGACTVHLRGRAVKSCQVEAQSVAGAAITTIEGLSANGTHPLQVAWKELDVPE